MVKPALSLFAGDWAPSKHWLHPVTSMPCPCALPVAGSMGASLTRFFGSYCDQQLSINSTQFLKFFFFKAKALCLPCTLVYVLQHTAAFILQYTICTYWRCHTKKVLDRHPLGCLCKYWRCHTANVLDRHPLRWLNSRAFNHREWSLLKPCSEAFLVSWATQVIATVPGT